MDAEDSGIKVLGLGLLNKSIYEGKELISKLDVNYKIRIADGTTLAVAWVINSIPADVKNVLMIFDTLTKLEIAIAHTLCKRGLKVQLLTEIYDKVKSSIPMQFHSNLTQPISLKEASIMCKTWIVGREIGRKEQMEAQKGTRFMPMMALPITSLRKDCLYESTPAMQVPNNLENLHSCENWLPRGVMSVWKVGGIVHAVEGWSHHEFEAGIDDESISRVWKAALKQGFLPHYQHYLKN